MTSLRIAFMLLSGAMFVGQVVPASADDRSPWSWEGRVAHHTATHHLVKLRDVALAYMADHLRRGEVLTVEGVQRVLDRNYRMRGLQGPLPLVATGAQTASRLGARNSERGGTRIQSGDVVILYFRGALSDTKQPFPAEVWWVAYAGKSVPKSVAKDFSALVAARDASLRVVRESARQGGRINRYDVERSIRVSLNRAGLGSHVLHDAVERLDTAVAQPKKSAEQPVLVPGRGFVIAPAVYRERKYGLRCSASVHYTAQGAQVTSPLQGAITPLLAESK